MPDGRVYEAIGGTYTVGLEDGRTVQATLRGRLKKGSDPMKRVVVGDHVRVEPTADGYTIEEVRPRSTLLVRARLGGRYPRPMAANLDRLLVVTACAQPDPVIELIDRLLVLGEAAGLDNVLVVNKVDLPECDETVAEIETLYAPTAYPVLCVSAVSGEGLSAFGQIVCSGTSVLAGASGVGKSRLLSRVEPGLDIRVGELGSRGGGRHTTVSSRLIPLSCGGFVADSPGFSEASLWGIDPNELDGCFVEMREPAEMCRFRECAHLHEPGCGVQTAVESGRISGSRYSSYAKFYEEISAARAWRE